MRTQYAAFVLGFVLAAGVAAGQAVIYVDDDAPSGGDGESWVTAYQSLQDGLDAASQLGGAELRVAGGTYLPTAQTSPGNPRTATFLLLNEVAIRGGYRGVQGGGEPDDRDVGAFVTILSGNIGSTLVDSDNCYHVLKGSGTDATAVLDGVTVIGGNAWGAPDYVAGGGILNVSGSPTLLSCTFARNSAFESTPEHDFGGGGAICNVVNSSPFLVNCLFSDNWSFTGGAMYNYEYSVPVLLDCEFSENAAALGGAMANGLGSDAALVNCTFRANETTIWPSRGGAIVNKESGPFMANCVFVGNSAGGSGGAIDNEYRCPPVLINCTFTGNSAERGAAMNSYIGCAPSMTNCIVWGNASLSGPQLFVDPDATIRVEFTCIQGGWAGPGNIDENPSFADADGADDVFGTSDDDLRLRPSSSCIDAGSNPAVPADWLDADGDGITDEVLPVDVDGQPRFIDGDFEPGAEVDMGAFEAPISDCNENGIPDGVDVLTGASPDCNTNGVPDECDIDLADPDGDGAIAPDCNENEVPDVCDIAGGTSLDASPIDGIPDECQVSQPAFGACCLRSACIDVDDAACVAAGGVYNGDDTTCDEMECPTLSPADLDQDGDVDLSDFMLFQRRFTSQH